jgi:hypothetical protein
LRKYRTFIKQMSTFADTRGYLMLDQLACSDIDVFYGGWNLGARATGKQLGTLRAFFRFCMNRKWLQENPVSSDIKAPIGANRVANKEPFTDEELQRIIDACDNLGEVAWSNGRESGVYTGDDLKDFIWVMIHTGLRISDVGLFNMSRLKGNEVFLRAKKNGGEVFAYIPDWLRDRLHARAKRCGTRPFVVGHSDRLETVTDMWRRKIGKIFDLAGALKRCPHRIVSDTHLRESCCNAECLLPTLRTFSATTKRQCASTIPDGFPKGRHGSRRSLRMRSMTDQNLSLSRCPEDAVKRRLASVYGCVARLTRGRCTQCAPSSAPSGF